MAKTCGQCPNLSKEWFKVKSAKTRKRIVFGVARLLTPILHDEIVESEVWVSRVPRPFTLMLKKVFDDRPLVGVEIGFGLGDNAVSLLGCLNIKRLFCVDPFIGKTYSDCFGIVDSYVGVSNAYLSLKRKVNVEFVELPSDEACKVLPSNLDFVYIDGCHIYSQVFKDLCNYFPLVRCGGFVGGHDFTTVRGCADVVRAVLDYAVSVGVAPVVSAPDFWFSVTATTGTVA